MLAPLSLFTSFVTLFAFKDSDEGVVLGAETNKDLYPGVKVFASLPANKPTIQGEIVSADARVEIVRQYLDYYNSPLEPLADRLVFYADKYDLDFRLTTAIAQQESNLCKKIPAGSNNCWGWGIHSQGTLGFDSFEEGIATVSQGIREDYVDLGYVSVEEIMSKWVPHSPEGAWAHGVETFMGQMQ